MRTEADAEKDFRACFQKNAEFLPAGLRIIGEMMEDFRKAVNARQNTEAADAIHMFMGGKLKGVDAWRAVLYMFRPQYIRKVDRVGGSRVMEDFLKEFVRALDAREMGLVHYANEADFLQFVARHFSEEDAEAMQWIIQKGRELWRTNVSSSRKPRGLRGLRTGPSPRGAGT